MYPSRNERREAKPDYFPHDDIYDDWEWYEPPINSAPVRFFHDTSLHGLKYLGQRRRHICERLFWFIAVIAAVVLSAVLIWKMWVAYVTTPIITVFSPTEKTLDQIPFPAVTICNVNNVKKSIWEENIREATLGMRGGSISNETLLRRFASIFDIIQVCQSTKTFTEILKNQSMKRGELGNTMYNRRKEFQHLLDTSGTLRNVSQPCKEMIIFCLWLGRIKNCSKLFQEIETDFGVCCTFNMIPVSLLKRFNKNNRDNPDRVKGWKEADVNYENILFGNENKDRKYPFRQHYAGRSAGLSFLVEPNLQEYYCTSTDSEGFVVGIHVPLDHPRMKDNGIAIRTRSEVFISVRPEITILAESAKKFNFDKRHCYIDGEKQLVHYTKYTASNCKDECIAKKTLDECKCVRYYMPRNNENDGETLCKPDKYVCSNKIREKIIRGGLYNECIDCWPSCTEIAYHTETTSLNIRDQYVDSLFDLHPNLSRARNASIIHVFFNVDSVFPRLRKEMSTTIDLISSAGGLLGLCMGFSLLSLLEILYHATIRLFFTIYRERTVRKRDLGVHLDESKSKLGLHIQHIHDKSAWFLSKMLPYYHGTVVRNFEDHQHQ